MSTVVILALGLGAYCIGSLPLHRILGVPDLDVPTEPYCRLRAVARHLLNILKGLIMVEIGLLWGMEAGHIALYGVVLGHSFPAFRSSGRTGLCVILGGLVALDPTLGLVALAGWTFAYNSFLERTVAALTAAVSTPLFVSWLGIECPLILLLPLTMLVIWGHRHRFSDWHLNGPVETEDYFRKL